MTKRNTKSNDEPRNIVLKTLHDDIMRDNPNFTRTTKNIRVWLRANRERLNLAHAHNSSWTFTQSEYDVIRSHFDAKYRERIARAAKRENATPRKRNAKTNDATPVVNDAMPVDA